MSAIAPDQEDDNQLFNVLTESQDSESSGEDQIPTNQNVLQQVQSTGSGSTLPEPTAPQDPSLQQGCSFWPHTVSPSIQSSPAAHLNDSDDSSPTASRPQRISGCPQQDGMGIDIFATLEDSSAIEPEVNIHTTEPPASPIKKLKRKRRSQFSKKWSLRSRMISNRVPLSRWTSG